MFLKISQAALIMAWLAAGLFVVAGGGCSPDYYKAQADKEVYDIIDQKWRDDYGTKANYIVNDVTQGPNDIKILQVLGTSNVITLEQAVAIATAQNRDYQRQKEALYLTALDLTQARYQFSRKWFATFDASYLNADDKESIGYTADGGFNQLLAGGATISTNLALNWSKFLSGDGSSLGSVFSGSVVQPLLRGSGSDIVQEGLTQSERDVLYQIRSFNRFRQTFVVSIISEYYSVLQAKDSVSNAQNNYNSRVKSKERLMMQAQAGRLPKYQVDQAEQQVLSARDNYVRSLQSYQQRLDEFKITLALPTDANIELDERELTALEKTGVMAPDYSERAAIETALVYRLDLANIANHIDDALRKVMVAADGLRTELNLVGSAHVPAGEDSRLGHVKFNDGIYRFGFETDFPVDRFTERNIYRETLINLQAAEREYDRARDEVKLDVREAYRRLEETAALYVIQKNSLELARSRVDNVTLLLEAGRAETRDLLEAQDALLSAQNALTASLVGHTVAKLNFYKDVGILQVRPDGMWERRHL